MEVRDDREPVSAFSSQVEAKPTGQGSTKTQTKPKPLTRKGKSRKTDAPFRCRSRLDFRSKNRTTQTVSSMVEGTARPETEPHPRKTILCSSEHAHHKHFTTHYPFKNRVMALWISRPPKTKAQQQHPKTCCRKSQTIPIQPCQSSFCRDPIPPPANIPMLSENWLSRPQSDDPKETRTPFPFSMLLKSRRSKNKIKNGRRNPRNTQALSPLSAFQLPQYTHT